MTFTMWCRLICVLLWSVCVIEVHASDEQAFFGKADSLLASGRFAEAALEYERVVFSQNEISVKAEALLKKGRCQKFAGNYEDALRTLKRADTLSLNETLSYRLHYEAALCAYLAENISEADFQLLQIRRLSNASWQDSCLLLQIFVDLEQERWEESRTRIIRYAQQKNLALDTMQLVRTEKELHLKNPKKARVLSLILPGLGQAYAGKPWRGLSSFLIVGGSAAYGVITVLQGYYVTGVLSGVGLTYRFYMGGARYAGRVAEMENARKMEAYREKVRGLLFARSLKP